MELWHGTAQHNTCHGIAFFSFYAYDIIGARQPKAWKVPSAHHCTHLEGRQGAKQAGAGHVVDRRQIGVHKAEKWLAHGYRVCVIQIRIQIFLVDYSRPGRYGH